jgi:hypothetical protein
MEADLYFASGGTGGKHENTINEPLCGRSYFYVFIWHPVTFCTLSVFMWHKSPTIKFSAQIHSSASNNLLYEKSVVGLTLETSAIFFPIHVVPDKGPIHNYKWTFTIFD